VAAEHFVGGKCSEAIRFAIAAEGDPAIEQVRGKRGLCMALGAARSCVPCFPH